ncbi:MAG: HAD-IA family hydrolase [Pseudomonadota bacterium]
MARVISHVMLDVDGVLIAGHGTKDERWIHRLKEDLGIEPEDLVRAFFAKGWKKVVTGEDALEPALAKSLDELGSTVEVGTLIDYWFEKDARLVTSVVQDTQRLREAGFKVILTTNQEHRRAAYLMTELKLNKVADGIVYSAQAGAQKPDRAFFEYAMRQTGEAPQAHLLVDDHAVNVDGARQIGWHGQVWASDMDLFATVTNFQG